MEADSQAPRRLRSDAPTPRRASRKSSAPTRKQPGQSSLAVARSAACALSRNSQLETQLTAVTVDWSTIVTIPSWDP
jgi:hypothetical protein